MKDRDNFLVAFDKLIKAALALTVAVPHKVTSCALELEKAVEAAQDAIMGWGEKNEMAKCCGNCYWNMLNDVVHGKCNPDVWLSDKTDRGRGICENWKVRER